MNAEMEKLYKFIGQSIADSIPGSWETARVCIKFEPGVVTSQAYYSFALESEPQSFKINYQTVKYFKELHALMLETPKGNWKQVEFKINKAGNFDLSFEY
jgi:hypothetical protein